MRKLYSLILLGLLTSAGVVFAMDSASDSLGARGGIKGRVSPEFLERVAEEGDIKPTSAYASSRSAEIMKEKRKLNKLLLKFEDGIVFKNLSKMVLKKIFVYIYASDKNKILSHLFDFESFEKGLDACKDAFDQYSFVYKMKVDLKIP